MSYSSMLLVQPLYDAQKQIDTLYKKYKTNVLEYNSKDANSSIDGQAPKNAVIQYYTNMVDALNKYNIIKASIKNEKAIAVRQILGVQIILQLIIVIVVIIILAILLFDSVKMFNSLKNILEIYTIPEIVTNIYFILLTIILSVLMHTQVIVPICNSYYDKYDVIYNTDVFNNSYAIKSIIDMMDIDTTNVKKTSDGEVRIVKKGKSSNPMMMWWLSKLKSISLTFDYKPAVISVESILKQYCSDDNISKNPDEKVTESGKTIDICSTESKCVDGYVSDIKFDGRVNRETIIALYTPCDIETHVQPFNTIEKDDIHSSKYLLKEIESYDKYNQINRLNRSILYFKGLLLRQNDADYTKITKEGEVILNDDIFSKLRVSYIIVKNLSVPIDHTYEVKNASMNETIGLCIDDEECCGFIYKEGQAYMIKKSDTISFAYLEQDNGTIAFIKSDVNITTEIYSIREPDIDNLNKIFNYNVENVSALDMYSYCVTNYANVCLNSTIFKAEADIGYDELFKLNSGVDSVFFYKYKTEFESIKKNNFKNNIKDTLLYMKPYLIKKIKDSVTKADPTISFRLNQDIITSKIKDFYGDDWMSVSSTILDIINETNNEISTSQLANEKNEFISLEKFSSKLALMKQDVFLSTYIQNINEIRFTSKNLYNLYKMYDYKQGINDKVNNALNTLYYIILVIGILEFCRFCFNAYNEFRTNDRLKNPIYYKLKDDDGKAILKWEFRKNDVKIIDDGIDDPNNKWKTNYYNGFSDLLIRYSVFFLIYLFSIAMFYAWIVKRKEVYSFNRLISESNGDVIRNESSLLFSEYVEMVNNKLLFPLKNGFVIKDHILDDMRIEYMIENSEASIDKDVNLGTIDFESHYEKLKNIVVSYDKCNYLLDGDIESVPFPALEFTMYLLLLLVVLAVIIYMFSSVKPLEKLELLKVLMAIKKIIKNGGRLSAIDDSIIEDGNVNTGTLIKLILFILIVVAALFITVLLYSNTNSFASSLYTSDLFKDRNCYSVT